MKTLKQLVLICFCFISYLYPYNTYNVLVDPKFSPYDSAPTFILLHQSLQQIEDTLLKNIGIDNRYVKLLGKSIELVFIWQPINEVLTTVQHEVFGHGYVGRDDSVFHIKGYRIGVPFPYGRGGGETLFSVDSDASVEDMLLMDIGGVNANAILANRIKLSDMQTSYIDGRSATFYLNAQQDLTAYVETTHPYVNILFDGNDIRDYVKWLGIAFPNNAYNLQHLQNLTWINLIDPMSYYAIFSAFQYIFDGSATKIYGFPIGKSNYLPNLRIGLAPYGPELFMENFVKFPKNCIYFYLKGATILDKTSLGLGMEYPRLYNLRYLSLGFRLDLWKQIVASSPFSFITAFQNSQVGINNEFTYSNLYGGALSLIAEQSVPNSPLSIYAQIGYKTHGFLPGESHKANPILRFGFGISF